MTSRSTPVKKVRVACQRCRIRRIKCDGQVPACSNCAKAGEACIDVDGQNADVLIPRNFTNAARSRIQWLEGIIRERLPDVDLTAGPQVGNEPRQSSTSQDDEDLSVVQEVENRPRLPRASTNSGVPRSSLKRSSPDHEDSLPEGAHSIAVNLGMLSLNSDSSQKHYLGSSSGLLFTNLSTLR